MFTPIDWSKRSLVDQAFMTGYLLAQYKHAAQQIACAVGLLSAGTGNPQIVNMTCLQTDTALIQFFQTDFSKLEKPDAYYEMAPFVDKPNQEQVHAYARLRQAAKYVAFDANIEGLVQAAIAKLTAGS